MSLKKRAKASQTAARTKPRTKPASVASARASLAAHHAKAHRATGAAVETAVRSAWKKLRKETKGEHLFALALYTSGQDAFAYVGISACTEEGLTEAAQHYLARHPDSTIERERDGLRWNACDWPHHDYAEVPGVRFGPQAIRSRAEDAAIWDAFAMALERCDAAGIFGTGADRERLTLAILCGDMGSRFFGKGVRRLNPPAVVNRTLREWRRGLAPRP